MAQVLLDDKLFTIETVERNGTSHYVHRITNNPFSPSFRTTGQQQQSDLTVSSSLTYLPPTRGFCCDRIPTDQARNPEFYKQFWDSTCETRFGTGVYLPILEEAVSAPAVNNTMRTKGVDFKGNFFALWEEETGRRVRCRQNNTTGWGNGGNIETGTFTGDERSAQDLIVSGASGANNVLVAGLTGNATATNPGDTARVYTSSDGATWVDMGASGNLPTAWGTLATGVTQSEDLSLLRFVNIGNELCGIFLDRDTGLVTFETTADLGATAWNPESPSIITNGEIRGVAVHPFNGVDRIYLLLDEGLWEIDPSAATWTAFFVRSIPQVAVFGDRLAVGGDGLLWIGVGVSDDEPVVVGTLDTRGDSRDFRFNRGLNQQDGVPSELLGPIRFMIPSQSFMYASVGGGAASRNARVICHNGEGWHTISRNSTANEKYENVFITNLGGNGGDDNTLVLQYAVRESSTQHSMLRKENINTNPNSGVSISRETSGYVEWPRINGGMPNIPAAWLLFRGDASALDTDTSGRYVTLLYGGDSEVRTAHTSGDIFSGTPPDAVLLKDEQGVNSVSIAPRMVLHNDSGTATNTPVMHALELNFDKRPDDTESFVFRVNIEATAKDRGEDSNIQVIKDIQEAKKSKVLVPFTYPGLEETKYVRTRLEWGESFDGQSGDDSLALRWGIVDVTCSEII